MGNPVATTALPSGNPWLIESVVGGVSATTVTGGR